MTLREKQSLFVRCVVQLLQYAHEQGYEITFGDAYRDPKHYGHPRSCHAVRLAIDLNLFKGGRYLVRNDDHKPLGEYWETLHPLCRWGGRFGDGNHYSITHEGVA